MTDKEPCVYCVVTNWNALKYTVDCVESLLKSDYANTKIVIVDNGSTNGCADELDKIFPNIPQIRTGFNGAVTKAYNLGLQYGLDHGADYLLLMNNDTIVDSMMITHLINAALEDPNRGIIAPKIFYFDDPTLLWYAGADKGWDFGEVNGYKGQKDSVKASTSREVDYAWGCGMLFSRKLLEEIGLIDTRFWLYYEDAEISLRAQDAGSVNWYEAKAVMWHKEHGSTLSPKFVRIWAKSKILFYRLRNKGFILYALIAYAFLHGIFRSIISSKTNSYIKGNMSHYLAGLRDGLSVDLKQQHS